MLLTQATYLLTCYLHFTNLLTSRCILSIFLKSPAFSILSVLAVHFPKKLKIFKFEWFLFDVQCLEIPGDHNVALFGSGAVGSGGLRALPPGKLVDRTTPFPANNLPAAVSPFVGRSSPMSELLQMLMGTKSANSRMVQLTGIRGVGKTAIALMSARYLIARKVYFKDGVFYVDCKALLESRTAVTLCEMLNVVLTQSLDESKWRVSNSENVQELVSGLKLCCRFGLFILDHFDELVAYYSNHSKEDRERDIYSVMKQLLLNVSEKIKLVVISRKKMSEIYDSKFSLSPQVCW